MTAARKRQREKYRGVIELGDGETVVIDDATGRVVGKGRGLSRDVWRRLLNAAGRPGRARGQKKAGR